uniref:Glutaredoxin-like protein n=1 Tax=Chelonoidis abingdonii TaxID=106734 RepID=A0A8C0QQR8_CHEAB
MLWFESTAKQLAKYSSRPLWRRLCAATTNTPVLTLFTKFILQEVDITLPENAVWYDKYKYDIPVFHLNGQFLMKHRVDVKKFENQLVKLEFQNDENQ